RHDESRVGLTLRGLRAPLHLPRILDTRFFFGRESARGALLRVVPRAAAVVIEAHLHFDHPLELRGILSGLARALLEGRQQRVLVKLGALAARDDDPVAFAPREGRGLWSARREEDGDRLRRLIEELRLPGVEVLAVERHVVLGPELLDELHRLPQSTEALAGLGPIGRREWRLVHGLAAPEAQEHATGSEERDRRHGLRNDGWVVAERRRHHARSEARARRFRRHRSKPREGEGRVAARVAPGMEVVAYGNAVVAELLREHGVVEEPLGVELLRGRFP